MSNFEEDDRQSGPARQGGHGESIKKTGINPHLAILAAIAVLFLLGVIILLNWNRGVPSEFDPTATTTDFDVEEWDFIMPLAPELLAGRADDGELHILCLGNNPFSDETGENGLAALIARETGGITYNGAFPASTVRSKSNPEELPEFFSLFYVTMALVNNDFSHLFPIAAEAEDRRYAEALAILENVDMQKIDVLVIMYDTTDYNKLSPAHNPNDDHDLNAFTGALRTSVESFQKFFPQIRIILMSHSYARYLDEDGQLHNGTVTDLGNGNIPHYLIMEYEVATDCGISFIDNYFGTIHEENYPEYMTDHMHYNNAGRQLLAKRAAKVILG